MPLINYSLTSKRFHRCDCGKMVIQNESSAIIDPPPPPVALNNNKDELGEGQSVTAGSELQMVCKHVLFDEFKLNFMIL